MLTSFSLRRNLQRRANVLDISNKRFQNSTTEDAAKPRNSSTKSEKWLVGWLHGLIPWLVGLLKMQRTLLSTDN